MSSLLSNNAKPTYRFVNDPDGERISTLRARIGELEAENARLIHLRALVARAFGILGPTGYFPSMGAPLSDEIRNVLAKDYPSINAVSGSGADRVVVSSEREG